MASHPLFNSAILSEIVETRRQLHQIPELQYQEFKTAALIARKLKAYGYQPVEGVAKTGVVALLDTGRRGKTIALRADLDALPIHEDNIFAHRSRHPGKMHACGHDGHTATLLAVAWALQQIKAELSGRVKFIFQPAEEGGKGSSAMIAEGVLERPKVDAIFGYHNWPGLPLGAVATRVGAILAGSGRFEIEIQGGTAHLAMPENAINPVVVGAAMIQALAGLPLNLTAFNSGDPLQHPTGHAQLVGCYFVESQPELEGLKRNIEAYAERIAATHGASLTVNSRPFQGPTENHPLETAQVLAAAREFIDDVRELPRCMKASEDFSEYLKEVPGCFFLVGAGETAPLHTAKFDFPDTIIGPAAEVMVRLAKRYLHTSSP